MWCKRKKNESGVEDLSSHPSYLILDEPFKTHGPQFVVSKIQIILFNNF